MLCYCWVNNIIELDMAAIDQINAVEKLNSRESEKSFDTLE